MVLFILISFVESLTTYVWASHQIILLEMVLMRTTVTVSTGNRRPLVLLQTKRGNRDNLGMSISLENCIL